MKKYRKNIKKWKDRGKDKGIKRNMKMYKRYTKIEMKGMEERRIKEIKDRKNDKWINVERKG